MRIRMVAATAAATLFSLAVFATPANADPKNGDTLDLHCDGIGDVTIALTPHDAGWAPGLVTTSTQVLIPYSFHFEGSFTDSDGVVETFVDDVAKPAPRNKRTTTCTFHDEGPDEGGYFVIDGTVLVSITPSH
jgi:hypothetical protein